MKENLTGFFYDKGSMGNGFLALVLASLAFLCCSGDFMEGAKDCLLYTSPSPRDKRQSRMPSSA